MKPLILYGSFLFLMLCIYFSCTSPTDPNIPENSTPTIRMIDGRTDSLIFNEGDLVLVQIELLLMQYIDSIAVSLIDTEGYSDTVFFLSDSQLKPQLSFKIQMEGSGIKYVKVVSYNQKSITRTDSMFVRIIGDPKKSQILLVNDTAVTTEDNTLIIPVMENDVIPLSKKVHISGVTNGKLGDAVNKDTVLIYKPAMNVWGNDTITYSIDTLKASVFITITAVQDKPEIHCIESTTVLEGNERILTFVASDADSESVKLWTDSKLSYVHQEILTNKLIVTITPPLSTVTNDSLTETFTILSTDSIDTVNCQTTIVVYDKYQKPAFVLADSVISMTEDESDTVRIVAVDLNGEQISYSVEYLPSWITSRTFRDSVLLYINTVKGIVPDGKNQKIDSVVISATNGTDTIFQRLKFIVNKLDEVNNPPLIKDIANQTVKARSAVVFTLETSDSNGDSIIYSAIGLPKGAHFDNVSGYFEWQPDYDQWSDIPYSLTFIANDGDLSDSLTVEITVELVNRPPQFILTPPKVDSANLGSIYTAAISFSDPDSQVLVTKVFDKSGRISSFKNGNEIKLTWNVDKELYTVGYEDSVEINVSDINDTIRYWWKIIVKPHIWTILPAATQEILLLAAKDSSNVFISHNVYTEAPYSEYTIYKLSSNNVWSPFHTTNFTGGTYKKIMIRNEDLWGIGVDNTGYGSIAKKIDLQTAKDTTMVTLTGVNSIGDINISGTSVLICYFSTVPGMPASLKYHSTSLDTSISTIAGFNDIQFTTDNMAFGISSGSNAGLYRMNSFSPSEEIGGFAQICPDVFQQLITIDNNSDTLYLCRNGSLFRAIDAKGSNQVSPVLVTNNVINATMISGKVGWAITSDSTLFFTNDGFSTMSKEKIASGSNSPKIRNIVIAEDKKSVYVYDQYNVYRY